MCYGSAELEDGGGGGGVGFGWVSLYYVTVYVWGYHGWVYFHNPTHKLPLQEVQRRPIFFFVNEDFIISLIWAQGLRENESVIVSPS